jgi:oligosaccharide repeat unit polymerase
MKITSALSRQALDDHSPRALWGISRIFQKVKPATGNLLVILLLLAMAGVAIFGLLSGNTFLCVETLFLAFIPYLIWSSYRRVGCLDFLAPDLGFPLAYIVYLFFGSIDLPIQTQFGLTIPWILWVYYILGLVAYLAGVRLFRPPSPQLAAYGSKKFFWPSGRFLTLSLLLLAVGVLARAAIVMQSGFEIFHVQDEAARVVGAKGVLAILSLCMEPAIECLFLYMLVRNPSRPMRIAIILGILLIGLNAVSTTNRTGLLRILLAGFVIFHYAKRRVSFAAIAATGLFVAVFASALGTFRDVSEWGDRHIQELEEHGFTSQTYWLVNGYDVIRLPTETFLMTTQEFPEIQPYTFGRTTLAELGVFFPGHTTAPGEIVKNKLRLHFVGFGAAATILAPLWIDGGVTGILVGMFVIGLISRFLHQMALSSSSYLWILIYAWYMQNTFKAIKDDILPDIGILFVIPLFIMISYFSDISFEGWRVAK